jgi:ubiquinone/menaquinone biosynthesis C-methylase UbiE
MPQPQNIYDDPAFFEGYERLRQSRSGLNEVLEQPALRSMLPAKLDGLRILDLGCGFGDFARMARGEGAGAVVGVDPSRRMLERAAAFTHDPGITYRRMSVEQLDLGGERFDLVVSSLALHYVEDYAGALARIARTLVDGGRLAFSVEHPICTARAEQQWMLDSAERPLYWPVDDYHREGRRETRWFVDGVIKYHRTVETYVMGLLSAGFALTSLLEPLPREDVKTAAPNLDLHRRRPPFLLLAGDLQGKAKTPPAA